MKIALVSEEFKNKKTEYNLRVIQHRAEALARNVDMISFGEGFLQGFDALTWKFEEDKHIAVSRDSDAIIFIKNIAKKYHLAISFGYFELDEDGKSIYCSYMVIDHFGQIIYHYRRVSIGWKEHQKTDFHYREGHDFGVFTYLGKRISVALCGDLWYKKNIKKVNMLEKDIILWPLHIDYSIDMWDKEKVLYEKQSSKLNKPVLMVNNICDSSDGGACYFINGKVISELGDERPGFLIVDI
ncbi:carbon-nitrogen hydrolase family protein [Mycoplasmatota bacterium]|nr:carbon-nitrogen hydrolase family protein [Mycoplasmatota bacterium]